MVTESRRRPFGTSRTRNLAEKYVNMRTQAFTRAHAREMQKWLDEGRGSEDDYYAWFLDRSARVEAAYEEECRKIDADRNMNYKEKVEQKMRLPRMYPAWTAEQERNFITVYGDPRAEAGGALDSILTDLEAPTWENAMREGQPREINKHPWERKFAEALLDPKDGSVPVYAPDERTRLISDMQNPAVGIPVGPISTTPRLSVTVEDEREAALLRKLHDRMCRYCGELIDPRGVKNHMRNCDENPEVIAKSRLAAGKDGPPIHTRAATEEPDGETAEESDDESETAEE